MTRIDRTRKDEEPATPAWDNSGLRARLRGHDPADVPTEGLHELARERQAQRRRRFRRSDAR